VLWQAGAPARDDLKNTFDTVCPAASTG